MHTERANKLRRRLRWLCAVLVALLSTGLMAGCGGGGGGGTPSTFVGGSGSGSGGDPVGTRTCQQCHYNSSPTNGFVAGDLTDTTTAAFLDDLAQQGPASNYLGSVHDDPPTRDADYVKCEGCHGNGSQHFGVGPIPTPQPGVSKCGQCHVTSGRAFVLSEFKETQHANGNNSPEKFFSQGTYGDAQATFTGVPNTVAAASG